MAVWKPLAVVTVAALLGVGIYLFQARDGQGGNGRPAGSDQSASAANSSPPGNPSIAGNSARSGANPNSVAAVYTPAQALAQARAISRCTAVASAEPPLGISEAERAEYEKSLTQGLDCANLDSKFTLYDLVQYAADAGDVQAQLDFAPLVAPIFDDEKAAMDPDLMRRFKADSLRYLQAAARQGNPDAHIRLSESYQSGRYTNADPLLAYAHAYIYARGSGTVNATKFMENAAKGLTAAQIDQARALAARL